MLQFLLNNRKIFVRIIFIILVICGTFGMVIICGICIKSCNNIVNSGIDSTFNKSKNSIDTTTKKIDSTANSSSKVSNNIDTTAKKIISTTKNIDKTLNHESVAIKQMKSNLEKVILSNGFTIQGSDTKWKTY